jgi:hypothetical protein
MQTTVKFCSNQTLGCTIEEEKSSSMKTGANFSAEKDFYVIFMLRRAFRLVLVFSPIGL